MDQGHTVTVRNSVTKEADGISFRISTPEKRVIVTQHRNNNIFAQIAETCWMLSGRDDVEFLEHYLPRAGDFSDDGKTWRAGYGPRIREWIRLVDVANGHGVQEEYIDQLEGVVELLKKDLYTRQAVISIWDPARDLGVVSKDIPCNNWLHFLVRNNINTNVPELNMYVAIRSNDLIWGASGINWFEWSVLQAVVASAAGIGVGSVVYNVSSLHIYDKHFSRALNMFTSNMFGISCYDTMYVVPTCVEPGLSIAGMDAYLQVIMTLESEIREGENKNVNFLLAILEQDKLFLSFAQMILIYNYFKQNNLADAAFVLNMMEITSDFRYAAVEYFWRTDKAFLKDYCGITDFQYPSE
jgi:thymidylate synthase